MTMAGAHLLHNLARNKALSQILKRGVKNIDFGNPTIVYIKGGGVIESTYFSEFHANGDYCIGCDVWYIDRRGKRNNVVDDSDNIVGGHNGQRQQSAKYALP